MKNFPATA